MLTEDDIITLLVLVEFRREWVRRYAMKPAGVEDSRLQELSATLQQLLQLVRNVSG